MPATRHDPAPDNTIEHQEKYVIRIALAGLGKMGLSHLAILRAHPEVELVAACDGLAYLTSNLEKHTGIRCYGDYDRMLDEERLDAVVIATPSKAHAHMVGRAIDKGLHVFCEKPFVLDLEEGARLTDRAEAAGLVTQIGYHYRFVGAFSKAREIIRSGQLGRIHHVRAEAYGPVVLRPKGSTWRSKRSEGGGVVFDYACHAIDLVNYAVGPVLGVSGVVRNAIFSRDVDDEVYCSLQLADGVSGQLAANWSDESQRKMSTKLSVWGEKGSLSSDRQECAVYLREAAGDLGKGWSVLNTTELTDEVWYYLRGEEYSAQVDEFVRRIRDGVASHACDFRSALETDRIVAMINGEQPAAADPAAARPQRNPFQALLSVFRGSHG